MLDTHRQVAEHKGYKIYLRDPGFEFTPVMLAKVASFIVQDQEKDWSVYAFMYSLLSMLDGAAIEEDRLLNTAVDTIQAGIDSHDFRERTERTYEYRDGGFNEVTKPKWWIAAHA